MSTKPVFSPRSVTLPANVLAGCLFLVAATLPVAAANQIWTGLGADNFWETGANWSGGGGISPGDSLFFGGTIRDVNTNNFPTGTTFTGITFTAPAGPFALFGNPISLGGNLTNNQVVTTEAINLPLQLAGTPSVDVVPNGVLAVNGVISGPFGLTKVDGGEMILTTANTFTGPLDIFGGTVLSGADPNLGAVPASATPGDMVIDGGALRATNSFTINANRGIAVGNGGIIVDAGKTLTYSGVIANNGGSGGLSKSSFGGLTLSGANLYTGPTIIQNGLLTLNFSAAGAPANNIISSSSPLTVGGATAGVGQTNYAAVLLTGKASTANSQTFNGTLIAPGGEFIQATSGTGGSANLALGSLSHTVGGTVVLIPPASGSITTLSANNNGILGGWATIGGGALQNGVSMGTNFASVGFGGVITNYNGYFNYSSGLLAGQVGPATNLLFSPTAVQVITVNNDNSGQTTDLNAMKILNPPSTNCGVYIGPGNTLRLGQYGGILAQEGAAAPTLFFGGTNNSPQTGNKGMGVLGAQDVGTLTAGGAPNTPGEIALTINNNNETSGSFVFECAISDNGSGPVSFVKSGPGPMKLDGHNTFSGGLYILQGRLQFAGTEIGTGNPGAGGTGPIYVYPGAEFFPSGAGTDPITNNIFLSGNGVSDGVGSIRLSGVFSNGVINLIGDSRLGGGGTNANATPIYDKITGPFNIDFGATGNSGSSGNGAILYNQSDDWSGNTTIVGRTGSTGNTLLINGASDVIPDGFGKGNVIFGNSGNTVSITAWDLHGFNETINGLISVGTVPSLMFITNLVPSSVSTLTVGNNDQSGTFSGAIRGNIGVTKIGAGIETLTGTNTYSGATTVNAGTLALSGGGSISNGVILINAGGTFDGSGVTAGFSTPDPVAVNGGTLVGNGTVGALGATNGMLTLNLNATGPANITAGSLTTGGTTNIVNIASVAGVNGYPAQFTLIQYSGSIGGAGNNFGIGAVPSPVTVGYISNDIVNSRIVLVLLNGPKALTWTGTDPVNPTFWDLDTTTNWIGFKGSPGQAPAPFSTQDSVLFDDTGATGNVDLISALLPGTVEITNSVLNYTFSGIGALGGSMSLSKYGPGSVTFLETGGDSYKGAISVNAGTMTFGADNGISGGITISNGATVQVGLNSGTGTLPGGNVVNSGSVIFDRGADLTVPNVISGPGSLSKLDANILTLSGANTFTGAVTVAAGTLRPGSGTALGTADGNTTISSGATLDVNGQALTNEPVVVSGTGVGGNGAIINSGADDLTALGNVTLAGNTTVGGNGGRWDIRGGSALLSTSSNPYSLTKIGTNYVAIVGINVDGALGDINVLAGLLSIETNTTGLGDSSHTLTVSAGATLQFYNTSGNYNKQLVLNGDGVTTTLNCLSGPANTFSGPITLNGACIFNSTAGSALVMSGPISGSGSLLKTGTGTNTIFGSATFGGATTVSNGTLVVDGSLSGAATIEPGATLAGTGTASGTVAVSGGSVSPGDVAMSLAATFTVGTLSLNNSTVAFDLSSTPVSGNDLVNVTTSFSLSGNNTLVISPITFMNVGDQYTLIQYAGTPLPSSVTNNLAVISTKTGFSFQIVDPGTTPNAIKIQVVTALGNDFWTGAASSVWDTTSINWLRNNNPVAFNPGDFANFTDSSTVTNVTLPGAVTSGGITVSSSSEVYNFIGTGKLTGPGGLHVAGVGLVIANNNTNDFTGPMLIDSGALILGNGFAIGNVGPGVITNNGSIIFNRTDTGLDLNNAITGSGSLSLVTNGTVTLGGASTFSGAVNILMGTVRAASSGSLGNNNGNVNVNPGATLDVTNSADLAAKQIFVSGTGVNGNGAIINDSDNATFIGPNIVNVTLNGDTTIGGNGRLDFRASTATAEDAILFGGFNLTKVGTNLLQLAGVQIDPTLGAINVGGGTFGIQWQMPDLGDPNQNLSISNGATFAIFDLSNAITKVLVLNNGSTVANQHGTNTFSGPVTLIGTNNFNISGAALILNDTVSGTGNLLKTGADPLILSSSAEIYTGNTYVSQGSLVLSDIATISSSPEIVLSNATIDVTSRNDGTLTLGSAGSQTLAGGGTVSGNLVEDSGSVVNPGNGVAPAKLTVSSATLNGTVTMDLNRTAGAVTNDEIICPTITVSGSTLIVTNLGPDLLTSNRFQLFSVPVSGFASVQLPVKNAAGTITYSWQNNLSSDGSILLLQGASAVNTNPTNITFSVSGGNLTLSWPADHTGWQLQVQTNSLAVGVSANWVNVAGSTSVNQMSFPLSSASGCVFYRLVYP